MKISPIGPPPISLEPTTVINASTPAPFMGLGGIGAGGGWQDVMSRISKLSLHPSSAGNTAHVQAKQLEEMIKLQMDVSHYQLKVELVSKVSESGVASIRKLQQTQ